MTTVPNLPIMRYRFEGKVLAPILTPSFAGSMLRGAFGHALRKASCMTKMKDCKSCPLYRSCPYPKVFETPPPEQHPLQKFSQIPNPYVIEPPLQGEKVWQTGEPFVFHMVLIGQAISELPLIIEAWKRALLSGIGKGRGKIQLTSVAACYANKTQKIYHHKSPGHLEAHTINSPQQQPIDQTITLQITTPMRLNKQGKPVSPKSIQPRDLLITLIRRQHLMQEFHGNIPNTEKDFPQLVKIAESITLKSSTNECHWFDWKRYSGRQKQLIPLGGIVGKLTFSGNLAPFSEALQIGQLLHIGKSASLGMGQYHITH